MRATFQNRIALPITVTSEVELASFGIRLLRLITLKQNPNGEKNYTAIKSYSLDKASGNTCFRNLETYPGKLAKFMHVAESAVQSEKSVWDSPRQNNCCEE